MRYPLRYKALSVFAIVVTLSTAAVAQNVGIHTTPTFARLQVVSPDLRANAIFGTDSAGISIGKNMYGYISIMFNSYQDTADSYHKYLSTGYSASIGYNTPTGQWNFQVAPSGAKGTRLQSYALGLSILYNGRVTFSGSSLPLEPVVVGRGTDALATAEFAGTTFKSWINYGFAENTYLRGGKNGSRVIFNDITDPGINLIGGGSTYVGINKSVPSATLDIVQTSTDGGMMIVEGYDDKNWDWVVNTNGSLELWYNDGGFSRVLKGAFNPANGAYTSVSDARLKTSVMPLGGVLERLNMLEPVSYQGIKQESQQKRALGFIAQEVQPLFPELIAEKFTDAEGKSSFLHMNYSELPALTIKALQEQQEQIDELNKQNQLIRARINALKKQIK